MSNIFIILNYNSFSATKRLVTRLYNYKNVDHIVVVDNASVEKNSKNLKNLKNKKVSVLFLNVNHGYAAGNNFGIRFAVREYGLDSCIFIVNPDVMFSDETISILNKFFIEKPDKKIGAVSPLMQNGKAAWKFTSFYKNLFLESNFFSKYVSKFNFYDRFYKRKIKKNQSYYLQVDVLSGAFFAIPAKVLKDVKYFDEGTFLYYEEEILAKKLAKKKYSSYLLLNCEYSHNHNYKSGNENLAKIKILNKSREYFFNKYFQMNKFKKKCLILSNKLLLFEAYLKDKKNN